MKNPHCALLLPLLLALHAHAQSTLPTLTPADLDTIRARLVRSVIPTAPPQLESLRATAARHAAAQSPDGSWPDINYRDDTRSNWAPREHLLRTLTIAKASRSRRDAGTPDAKLHAALLASLSFWTKNDFQNPNWWWNQIGVPQLLSETAALAYPDLPPDHLAAVSRICKHSTWEKWTGQNLVWGVQVQIVRGCVENDPATVAAGYQRLYDEVRVVGRDEEGIQPDASFHQHGKQLYSGGYGLAYANDVGRFVAYAWGTPVQIPAKNMDVLTRYLLDGQAWMIQGNVFDYSAVGREITRKGKVAVPLDWTRGPISPAGPAYSLGSVVTLLSELPVPRQDEYRAFAKRLHGDADAPPLTGSRSFYCSDYLAHRRPGYLATLKLLSDRMVNAELVNDEGKLSHHLSDGVCLLYQTGDEYKDIFPVWNWTQLPGTTAEQRPLTDRKGINRRNPSPFAGSVSDGTYAAAAMDLRHDTLSARKAWFLFGDTIACLGAGITSTSDNPVTTTVNQCRLQAPVTTSGDAPPPPAQTNDPRASAAGIFPSSRPTVRSALADRLLAPSPGTPGEGGGEGSAQTATPHQAQSTAAPIAPTHWIHHDHIGYILLNPPQPTLHTVPHSGSWSLIGTGSPDPVTLDVFSLTLPHGPHPTNATYAYLILTNTTPNQTAERTAHPTLHVLSNTPALQAVHDETSHTVAVVFYQPGACDSPLGRIEVSAPCLALLRKTADKTTLSIADPMQKLETITAIVGPHVLPITLPAGPLAGSSVTRPLPD